MEIEKIKQLVCILENSTLQSIEITEGASRIKLEKESAKNVYTNGKKIGDEEIYSSEITVSESAILESSDENNTKVGEKILSPMVGVFYRKPSPESEPFVQVGDFVKKGQTLCIIEAMKLMNEITAEKDGTVTAICAEDEELVEFGQELFYIA